MTLQFAPSSVNDDALNRIFRHGRTFNAFHSKAVPESLLKEAVRLSLDAPTAFNSEPIRIVFVTSPEAKGKLRPALSPGNADKTMAAPTTAIVAFDLSFHDHLPRLFPFADVKGIFTSNAAAAEMTAFRNGTLQAGYFILALRSLGLDVGPMSGFDNAAVDAAFFPDSKYRSNILVNIGYGDATGQPERAPRLSPDEVATFA